MRNTTQQPQEGQRDQDHQRGRERIELTLRLPHVVAERLRRLAQAHSRSLNGEIVWALQGYVAHGESERSGDDGTDE